MESRRGSLDLREAILEALSREGPQTLAQLSAAARRKKSHVRQALTKMAVAGLVRPAGARFWEIVGE